MRYWDRLSPTSHRVILAANSFDGLVIPMAPPPSRHCFLNARDVTEIQANCALIYFGNSIFLPTTFYQDLLQAHILVIPDPGAPTGLSPLLTPPSSADLASVQQSAVRFQFLMAMGQDQLFKEEAGNFLDQQVYVVTTTQDICHSTWNLVRLTGTTSGLKYPSPKQWQHGLYTFIALRVNMTRPSQENVFLEQIS